MAKRLRIRDKLLLAAALSGDLFFEFVQPLSFQLKKMKGILPPDYKLTNFTVAVSRMLKTGYIEKVIRKGEPYLRLTGIGRDALVRDFPLFAMRRKKWDGKWRIVYYDISEKDKNIRKQLREKLWELGFGMIQESVYISPFDVAEDLREFLIAQGLGDSVFVSVAKGLFVGDIKILAEKVWGLRKLNEEYLRLYRKLKEGGNFGEIFSEYEEVLKRDPCLPLELLPDDWLGNKVYSEIKNFLRDAKT